MDFATGALGTLLPKLGQLLHDEYNLQKGVKKDIEFLTRELESMRAALRDVGDVPQEQLSNTVKIWARDVRELSYDMEDIVDTFLVRVQSSEPPSKTSAEKFIKKMTSSVTKFTTRREVAQEIKDIKERVKEMSERRDRYLVNTFSPQKTTMLDPRLNSFYTNESELVGIQQAREQLITMLTKSDDISTQQQRVVSIVGFGGLGKTTVAKAVYEYLKEGFDCSAFVTVSRNPDRKKVLMDVLYGLDKEKYRNIHNHMFDENHLIDIAQEFLQNKRYIIVIDDIWEPHSWETIKLALVENNCGSTIIATTRNSEAVIGQIYKLPPLSHYNSKKLFYKRIFGSEVKSLDDQQEEVSNKFLKKCDGIPLAIITMASLLAGKSIEIWPELYTAVGFSHKDNMQVQNTMKIISFSYYDMPSHLRTCLLYLSAFPEDHVINKDPLIWKWIAEGFIHTTKEGDRLFEIGERYFNDLINRSLIQIEYDYDGEVITGCRVHDMVLDLIRSISSEENFLTILDNGGETSAQYKSKARRLACQKGSAEDIAFKSDEMDTKHLRSYIASLQHSIIIQQSSFLSFKFLRVLAMEHCTFTEDRNLKNIVNLIHLRYLSLRSTNIRDLPEHIGNLKFLQTLDLDETMLKHLPASIVKLRQLVCLSCHCYYIKEMPDGVGKMTSLEQLRIDVDWRDDNIMKELGGLTELRTLDINFVGADYVNVDEMGVITELKNKFPEAMAKSTQRCLVDSLRKLKKIQHLEVHPIEGADIDTWEAEGFVLPQQLRHLSLNWTQFPRLPSCVDLSRLHHLSYLKICVATLVEQDLILLGRLTELRYLSVDLRNGARKGVTVSKINAGDAFFPKLRFFSLYGAMVLFEHKNEDSSFSLHIWNPKDPMPFVYRRNSGVCRVRSAIMTSLEHLGASVYVRALKDGNHDCSIIGLDYLTSLRKVLVLIQCEHASVAEVNQAETALRDAVGGHPNHPTLELRRHNANAMISSDQDQVSEHGGLPQTGQEDNGDHDQEA